MDPLVTSALISTGGSVFGSLFGGGSSGPKAPSVHDQIKIAKIMATDLPIQQVRGWKLAGIHPLAGMGMNPASGPAVSIGGGAPDTRVSDALHNMGQGVSRAVEAWASKDERNAMRASMALDLENKRLQNTRLASEIRLMQTAGTPGLAGTDRTIQKYITLNTPQGQRRVINPEYAQVMESYWPEAARAFVGEKMDQVKDFTRKTLSQHKGWRNFFKRGNSEEYFNRRSD